VIFYGILSVGIIIYSCIMLAVEFFVFGGDNTLLITFFTNIITFILTKWSVIILPQIMNTLFKTRILQKSQNVPSKVYAELPA